nr:hypothetical protein [Limosilactobacillus kribbianus]
MAIKKRTINITYPAKHPVNGKTSDSVIQSVSLSETGTEDLVTGTSTWNNDWNTGKWESYTPTSIVGYKPSTTSVPEEAVTHDTADATVNITYNPKPAKTDIVYIDEDANNKQLGLPITLEGHTDDSIDQHCSTEWLHRLLHN